jgi:ankyrin repeat protein
MRREKDVLAELEKSPAPIAELYDGIFNRISKLGSSSNDIAQFVLRLLLISRYPLLVRTMCEAVTEAGEVCLDKDEILDLCRDLVVFDEETDTFRFAHLSVQEYLQQRDGFGPDELHTFVTLRCLEEFDGLRRKTFNDLNRFDPKVGSFHDYAVFNWAHHFGKIEQRSTSLVENLESFLLDEDAFAAWNHDSSQSGRWGCSYHYENGDISAINGPKASPTFAIAMFGLLDAFDRLNGQHSTWTYVNTRGMSPIHVAAHFGHLEVVKRLVDHVGVSANHAAATKSTPLLIACIRGHKHVVEYLLAWDGIRIDVPDSRNLTPLMAASRYGNQDICRILLDNGARMDLRNHAGLTTLHLAAMGGKLATVQLLHEKKADMNTTGSPYARTPLLLTMMNRQEQYLEVAKCLIQAGAAVNIKDDNGTTPLHVACKHGHLELVKLLLAKKAIVSIQDDSGNSPLHAASEHGHIEIVKVLVAKKATVSLHNNEGKTALDHACRKNRKIVIQFLLKHGAACEPDGRGRTELHEAVTGLCDIETIQLFLSRNVDVNAKDDQGVSKYKGLEISCLFTDKERRTSSGC